MSAKDLTRAWAIGEGRPKRLERRHTGREVVIAQMADPFAMADSEIPTSPINAGSWAVTVQHLDPRFKLVATPFFRRSSWFRARLAEGKIIGAEILNDVDGKNYTQKDSTALLVRKDTPTGDVHVIGAQQSDIWLNGGTVPDGTEISSATAGIRIKVDFATERVAVRNQDGIYSVYAWDDIAHSNGALLTFDKLPTYDLVCGLEVVPDIRLGCDGMADEIMEALDISIDPPITLTAGNTWSYEE